MNHLSVPFPEMITNRLNT
ncbi:hypothetical protein [Sporolactobacillus shoreicorticis]|uniref:Uncharacterized protein n=1 Tax=Sporolactobacillus shoreicorticis TaxID=1923877 RepID=A0ABW5S9I3_9BACL